MPDPNQVLIFDTTLRDGEQSPGISLNTAEKLEIAHQLARLGVDIIEAGFPIASPGDFEAVQAIAREVEGPIIAGLARANATDIETAWNAVKDAARPRIHTFVSTSDIHIEPPDAEHARGRQGPRARRRRAGQGLLRRRRVLADGRHARRRRVHRRGLPDRDRRGRDDDQHPGHRRLHDAGRVHALPGAALRATRPGCRTSSLSTHCHDDLGLAVANSFAGVLAGARQVECAINGIGERAGNASLEEIVMLLHTRGADLDGLHTGVVTTELARTSRLVSRLTGYVVQPNKAVVGRNAFAHESGIHQDGVLKERTTFEIMDATTVGLDANQIVLGKHSGRHALRQALEELGFTVDGQALNTAFKRFKEIADKKKQVTAMDLEALVTDELREELTGYRWRASTSRPPRRARRTRRSRVRAAERRARQRLVHRRRPDRRGLPRDQRRDRDRRAAARVPRRRGHRGPGRARRGQRRARARGPDGRRPGRLDGHHRGRRPRLPARARARGRQGRARRAAASRSPRSPSRSPAPTTERRGRSARDEPYVITYACT